MTIITSQLAEKLPVGHELLNNHVVNPLDYPTLHSTISNAERIIIYDVTQNKKHLQEEIIKIKDHVNRTGSNPLVDRQEELGINFVDISMLYKYEKGAVITNCCGPRLSRHYDYPSHYMCHISILARAMKIKEIKANLINII